MYKMTQRRKNEKRTVAYKTIKNCLQELISDLKTNTTESIEFADKLSKSILNLSDKAIFEAVTDKNSDLFKIISSKKLFLQNDESGKKYLQILGVFQPDYLVVEQENSSSSSSSSSNMELPETLRNLLSVNNENSELMELAEELMNDTALTQEIQNLNNLDIGSLMNLFQTVTSFVTEKAESGNIDIEKLGNQANNVFTQIQETPEIQGMIQGNPELSQLLNSLNTRPEQLD
jgi:cell fate (sporulation/competence/biofilm development) regulator YlbF (YheA/YmcA/DUF963 family)